MRHLTRFLRRLAAGAAIALPLAGPAAAEPSVQMILDGYPDQAFQLYLAGLSAGYGWYASHQGENGMPLIFCQPRDMALSNDQLVDILKRYATTLPEDVLEYPVGFILLLALEAEYPCEGGE